MREVAATARAEPLEALARLWCALEDRGARFRRAVDRYSADRKGYEQVERAFLAWLRGEGPAPAAAWPLALALLRALDAWLEETSIGNERVPARVGVGRSGARPILSLRPRPPRPGGGPSPLAARVVELVAGVGGGRRQPARLDAVQEAPDPHPEKLEGHRGVVMLVAFSPDGSRVATAGSDGSARLRALGRRGGDTVIVPTPAGWFVVGADGRWDGEGDGPELLTYVGPAEPGRAPTVWFAADLPSLRRGGPVPPPRRRPGSRAGGSRRRAGATISGTRL